MNRRISGTFFLLFVIFISASRAHSSQTITGTPKSTPTLDNSSQLSLTVLDKESRIVKGLTKDDFLLTIDGKEQAIDSLNEESFSTLSIIAVDNSGSLRMLLGQVLGAAKTIVRDSNENDLIGLMRFIGRDQIQATDKFTNNHNYLNSILESFYVEGGQTALFDAMLTGGQILEKQTNADANLRKTLIVVSDGEDRNSKHKEDELLSLLQKADVRVCFLGLLFDLGNEGGFTSKSPKQKSKEFIERITKSTGGFAIMPTKPEQLSEAAKQIAIGIHTQYTMKFRSDVAPKSGTKVQIKLSKTTKHKDLQFFFQPQIAK
jgi:VWFA-related protein